MRTYITDFIPWGKTYCFSFDKYNCFFRRMGICSLWNMILPADNKKYEKWEKQYCPTLASSILQQGFFQAADDVTVIKNACGHYCVEEGQHRICVCGRLKVPLKVVYLESNVECIICNRSKYGGVRGKLSYMLRSKTEVFIKL